MLVLSAVFTSPFRELISGEKLNELLCRTINFLWGYRNISPTLREDAKILQGIHDKIFKGEPAESFSSQSTEPIGLLQPGVR